MLSTTDTRSETDDKLKGNNNPLKSGINSR